MLVESIDISEYRKFLPQLKIQSRTNLPIRADAKFDGYNNHGVDVNLFPEIAKLIYDSIDKISHQVKDLLYAEEDGVIRITPFFGRGNVPMHKDNILAQKSMLVVLQGHDSILFHHSDSTGSSSHSEQLKQGSIFLFDPNENHSITNGESRYWMVFGVDFNY